MNYSHWTYRNPTATAPRRVVITGLGAISAAGIGVPALWESLLAGRSGIGPLTNFDASELDGRIAGEVLGFDPIKLIEPRLRPKRLSRQAQFAIVAASEAVRDAGLDNPKLKGRRGAVILGSVSSGINDAEESSVKVERGGPRSASAVSLPKLNMQGQATALLELLEMENIPSMCVSTSCMGGIDAVTLGASMIRNGRCDLVVCGGTESTLGKMISSLFGQAGMMSRRNDEPERASRPFDRERDTGVLAEGAGVLVIEELSAVEARGGRAYAEILGDHTCRDAENGFHGIGLATTMRTAMENANCNPAMVDYISAWGCGDPMVDRYETQSIKEVYGERAFDIAVGSIKGVTGNPLAAAGALQLVASSLVFRHGLLPPTANYEHADVDCDLDYIQGAPRRQRPRFVVVNAHGMGGGNTSVVLGRPPATGK
jgi:3-oxoacyl-[acyl-carrier-protein] synthase II